jgi:ribose-phosphate pyrophosphokinase
MNALVYPWPGCEALAATICAHTDGEPGELSLRHFPDGETYVRLITSPVDRDVIFLCGLDRPNDKMPGLLLASATARELGASSTGLVAPYLAYMRQDTRFNPGEAIASSVFAHWLSRTVDWLVTMDPHLHRHHSLGEIYSIPTAIAPSAGKIASWIATNVPRPLLIGPDEESTQWVSSIARYANAPWVVLKKERHGDRDVSVSVPDISAWAGHTPVLVDDIISTARTMVAAVHRLHDLHTAPPVCVGVHALFCGDAMQVLRAAKVQIIATCNTIPHETNAIDVAEEIGVVAARLLTTIQ